MTDQQKFLSGVPFTTTKGQYCFLHDEKPYPFLAKYAGKWEFVGFVGDAMETCFLIECESILGIYEQRIYYTSVKFIEKESPNKALRNLIHEVKENNLHADLTELYEWLRPGKKKDTIQSVHDLIALQEELIMNLTRELADLRKEVTPTENKFYPMSTNAKRRY